MFSRSFNHGVTVPLRRTRLMLPFHSATAMLPSGITAAP
jgi:hypothetical protein